MHNNAVFMANKQYFMVKKLLSKCVLFDSDFLVYISVFS